MDKNKTRVKANDGDDKVRRSAAPPKNAFASIAKVISTMSITRTSSVLKSTPRKTAKFCRAARPDFAPNISATLRPLSSARA